MSLINLLGISDAVAAGATPAVGQGGFMSMVPMLAIFVGLFYFLIIRPQNKRAKAHRELIAGISEGDEIATAGGFVGKVVKLTDDFIVLQLAEGVEINLQRNSVANVLPKGTMASI